MVKYTKDHIPRTTLANRRPGHALSATTFTIHNTGNLKSTARNERDNLTRSNNYVTASFHIVIDENEAIECIPLNESAWAAGDGTNGSGNRTSIHIEICESGNYAKTLDNAVELVASMLLESEWGVDRLRRHWDWPRSDGYRKVCPRLMYDNGKWTGWTEFKNRVAAKMQQAKESEPMSPAEKKAFDDLLQTVKQQQEVLDQLAKSVTAASERLEAPKWFVEEFGSGDLGGLISEPVMSKEGWRNTAISLRTQGFGKGRDKSVYIL